MTNNIKYYFSPLPTQVKTNEYVNNFCERLVEKVNLINYGDKLRSRSLDYFVYSLKSDVAILNWPEDVIFLRYGLLQTILTCLTFIIYKIRGKKIIWICHNKKSHKQKREFLSKVMREFFTQVADNIIVHSKDAVNYFKQKEKDIYYLPHPVYEITKRRPCNKTIGITDVLIWGNISRYKGLLEFLNYYKEGDFTFNVLIIGKADPGYFNELVKISEGTNVRIVDEFISEEDLADYFDCCKIIVLPYLDSDTFSSGALIHSLNSGKIVIGPNVGNFRDLNQLNACLTYSNLKNLFSTINDLLVDNNFYEETVAKTANGAELYYTTNSWPKFVDEIIAISDGIKGNKIKKSENTLSHSNADS